MATAQEILKDRRVIIGGAVVALLGIGGAIFLSQSGGSGGDTPPATPAASVTAPGPQGAPGNPGTPGVPGGVPGQIGPAAQANGVASKKPLLLTDSWADQPGGGGPTQQGQPPATGGGGTGAGGLDKLTPIVRGKRAEAFRGDPFISYRIPKYVDPPAYAFVVPIRLASQPKPTPPPVRGGTPEELLGPLPSVDRRVAGILHDGSVSAILETGQPGGAGTDVRIINPGVLVPSGIPGIGDLTVASIGPTQVVLRAEDGRTVAVKLGNVPSAYLGAFQSAVGANTSAGTTAGGPPAGAAAPTSGAATTFGKAPGF